MPLRGAYLYQERVQMCRWNYRAGNRMRRVADHEPDCHPGHPRGGG